MSEAGRFVYRLNGDAPVAPGSVLSACRLDPMVPSLLRIDAPGALPVGRNGKVRIVISGTMTEWRRLDSGGTVWLIPMTPNPLDPHTEYSLVTLADESLELKISSRARAQ
jgi:hypothetical protein